MGSTGVDVGALRAVAGEYERAADIVGRAVRDHLQQLSFGGSTAGRAYIAHGEALQVALHDLTASVSAWSRRSMCPAGWRRVARRSRRCRSMCGPRIRWASRIPI